MADMGSTRPSLVRKTWPLLLLGVLAFFVVRFSYEWKAAPASAYIATYHRVDWWVLSAECAQKRRLLLVACNDQGNLYPIEDVSPTDDRGHVLLLDVLALVKSTPPSRVDLVRINLVIGVVGVIMVALVLWKIGMPWAAIGTLAAGTWLFPISVRLAGPDVPSAFLGIFALAAVPTIWLSTTEWSFSYRDAIWGVISAGSLVASVLLRQAIGLAGVAAALLLVLLHWIRVRPLTWRSSILHLALLLVISAISQSISMMLVTRNRLIQLPPAHLIEGHGVAHALYQGLGTEPNPWGISNDDAVSQEAVLKSNPEAGYGTPLYYHEIGNMYLKIVTTQPLTVMNIYKRKLVKTAKLPLKLFGIPYIWYLILIGSVLLFTVSREALSSKHFCVLTALFGFLMIFIAEEVIIFPELRFIYPAKFGILVLLSIGADFIARKLSIAG